MVDWSKPALTSTKENMIAEILGALEALAKMNFDGDTNIHDESIKWDSVDEVFKKYDSGSGLWVTMFDYATPADLEAQLPVGSMVDTFASSAPTGWLLLQGGTIGSASSGATALASASAEDLYIHLWDNLANAQAAVSGGRGASGAADFAANKTLTLPNARQRVRMGKASSGTGATMGETGGSVDHYHTVAGHYHGKGNIAISSSGGHTHELEYNNTSISGTGTATCCDNNGVKTTAMTTSDGTHSHSNSNFTGSVGNTSGSNGDSTINTGTNNQAYLVVNVMIKL